MNCKHYNRTEISKKSVSQDYFYVSYHCNDCNKDFKRSVIKFVYNHQKNNHVNNK